MENKSTGLPASAPDWPWMNTSLSPDERAALVLAQLTLEEKISMVHGRSNDAYTMAAITRLGIPALTMTDGPAGINEGQATPVSGPSQYAVRDDFIAHFSEGLAVGYRGYDQFGIEPLYPFGYGLSYTSFAYGKLHVVPETTEDSRPIQVSFEVSNTGACAGAEVAQIYLGLPESLGEPPKRLVGWAKVNLKPGETREVAVTLDSKAASHPLSYWDARTNGWETADGDYQVYVGASSRDIRLSGILRVHHAQRE